MRILVVEDEELLAATVKRGLESDGHLVVVARRGAPERPAILSVGSLTVDPASRKAARSGVGIRLTAK